jgi:MFS family permease
MNEEIVEASSGPAAPDCDGCDHRLSGRGGSGNQLEEMNLVQMARKRLPHTLSELSHDGWLLLSTRALRLFAVGFFSIILAVYLTALGIAPAVLGILFAVALVGNAVMTALVAAMGDRIGRRTMLMASGVLMACAGILFSATDSLWLLLFAALIGLVSPSGGEIGTSLALEQAAMAEVTPFAHRTGIFAWSNLIASAATACGALAAGLPVLAQSAGLDTLDSYRVALWVYAGLALVLVLLFSRLSPAIEAARHHGSASWHFGLNRSRGLVARFALVIAFNAFAASFVAQPFVVYWFHTRFNTDLSTLSILFFLTNLVGALSYPIAAKIAARIGLVNTMVFTHLPSNIFLMLIPLMPTFFSAAVFLILRHSLSQMDRPARESYAMAIVDSNERTATAGYIGIATDAAAAAGVSLAGIVAQAVMPGLLFVIAGTLRCAYNGALFILFHKVRPTEEIVVERAHRSVSSDGYTSL